MAALVACVAIATIALFAFAAQRRITDVDLQAVARETGLWLKVERDGELGKTALHDSNVRVRLRAALIRGDADRLAAIAHDTGADGGLRAQALRAFVEADPRRAVAVAERIEARAGSALAAAVREALAADAAKKAVERGDGAGQLAVIEEEETGALSEVNAPSGALSDEET